MASQDTCCTIHPYFKIHDGKLADFKSLCEQIIDKTKNESGCLYYGFSLNEDRAHAREGYKNADSLLTHLGNVGDLFQQVLTVSDITRLEVHGPEAELEKLRIPLAGLNPEFWTLESGFRN